MKRLIVLVVAALLFASTAAATGTYDETTDAHVHAAVLYVGDSNVLISAASIAKANEFVTALTPRTSMGIRGYVDTTKAAANYWQDRLAQTLTSVTPGAVVVDLGINDSLTTGTATTTGYGNYGTKIDWLLAQLPNIPIIWTNLPCPLEQPGARTGCQAINAALANAPGRHANLVVLAWNSAAYGHPDYMGTAPHLSPAGQAAWASFVRAKLDALFP